MSETRVKVEELLRRAQALEEKVDKTLNKHVCFVIICLYRISIINISSENARVFYL